MEQLVENGSGTVEAAWAWYEKSRGIVEWGLRNSDSAPRSVILLRNSYYFGDAYWSIYSSNPSFHTSFIDGSRDIRPLSENGVSQNSAPLALVQFGDLGQSIVCLVFTLSPGQAWGMLEGGFTPLSPPSGISIHDVAPLSSGEFCIGYDPRSVGDWGNQTGVRFKGYSPNPSTFKTWLLQTDSTAPYRKVFRGDSILMGSCPPANVQIPSKAEPETSTAGIFPPVFPDVLAPPLNP